MNSYGRLLQKCFKLFHNISAMIHSRMARRLLTYVGALTASTIRIQVSAFSPSTEAIFGGRGVVAKSTSTTTLKSLASSGDITSSPAPSSISTLALLEHINLNVPNHEYILEFYSNVLGFGLDPRRAQNVVNGSGTVWMNCGASQFHLPVGDAQVIPGSIGLWYESLDGLKSRLEKYEDQEAKPFAQHSVENKGEVNEAVRIMDNYGNVFFCRKGGDSKGENEIIHTAKQPILYKTKEDIETYSSAAEKYGLDSVDDESECKGVSYVEFLVPRGTTEKIAEFYDCVFDATTTCFNDPSNNDDVAIVAFGSIDEVGRSSQNILFRESDTELPPYDGHHVALYVGESKEDFEQAFKNILEAQVLWVNPRFSDKVTNLNTAKKWKQFRFKHITDLKTGKKIFELEHECRSVEHDSWPGK